jgi:broad specificity phosphatase PhoE
VQPATEGQKWPNTLWIVRHGESEANVARAAAYQSRAARIAIDNRDMDVQLSTLGVAQSQDLGRWFGSLPEEERPTAIIASPYLRTRQTAENIRESAGLRDAIALVLDERLREREFGVFDGLTNMGIREKYPDLAQLRFLVGKFYHRPPGGESWADVILRLRSMLDAITRDYVGERLMIVCHSVVVLCFRYLLERMTEEQILAIDKGPDVANCSVTSYQFDPHAGRRGKLVLDTFNFVAPAIERTSSAI